MVEEAVTPDQIAGVVSRWTGIPVDRMLEGEREKLLKMEDALSKRVIGQREAVDAVSTAVRRARAGLQDPNRPIGSFMFFGPTGVGKTELAKALAAFLFDDETALFRIDMSEYMEKHSVARLIGAPPGYVGYEEGGSLTEAVRRRPYQVILFDEIEKAHPDVFNVLLQVLDDGRLTDGQGRTVDFRNTIIILTSNLGAEYLVNQKEGEDTDAVRDLVMAEVRAKFRPEFLNRLDDIILFHRLQRSEMGKIVDIQIARLQKLLADRKITIELDDKARTWLANRGYDPAYGARPLKRVIQRHVQDPLAEQILAGRVKDGDTVRLSVRDGDLVLERRAGEGRGLSHLRLRSPVSDPLGSDAPRCARCQLLARRHDGREVAQVVDAGALLLELGELPSLELALARHLDLKRIDEAAVDQHLVVQVRARGEAGGSDVADDLALAHLDAGRDALREAQHVSVGGVIAVGVADADVVAVLALAARLLDDAGARREHGRAGRGRPVDAGVHALLVQQRMEAHAEAGGEPHVLAAHRPAHQELLRVVAILVVVVDDPSAVRKR